jgi:methylated-DNA-[protein]-cysteine S-methyltransferase
VRRKAKGVGREASVTFKSKLGWAGVAVSEKGITMIALPRQSKRAVEQELGGATCPLTPALSRGGRGSLMSSEKEAEQLLRRAVVLLTKYFSGERVSFDLPLDLRYYTRFQQAVWKAAAEIPSGETRSYAWIAKRIRNPLAARAAGQALGANPIPIIIP